MYPIGELILRAIGGDEARKDELAAQLGYKYQGDASRNLDRAIHAGECVRRIRERLPAVLGVPAEAVAEAMAATERQKAQEAEERVRRAFRPSLLPLHAPVQSSVTIFTLGAGDSIRRMLLPEDIGQWPWERHVAAVRQTILEHQRIFGERMRVIRGGIQGYLYQPVFGQAVFFDASGEIAERPPDLLNYECRVTIKGRDISLIGGWLCGKS